MYDSFDVAELVRRHTPQLVVYPEITPEKTRKECWDPDWENEPPLPCDYHPRNIRIVLQNSGFHSRLWPWPSRISPWRQMLERMKKGKYQMNLDVLPGVKLDDRDRFWDKYATLVAENNPDYGRACYARVVRGEGDHKGRVLVQYWYPYFYNDFWNAHEMDWECIMIVFRKTDEDPVPTICACSAHHKGSWLRWADVEKVDEGSRPIIYVANGSHAAYFYGPRKYPLTPDIVANAARYLNRENRGLMDFTTSRTDENMHEIPAQMIPSLNDPKTDEWEGEWGWLNQQGLWGSPGDWDLEFGDSGPKGPPQAGRKWDRPFRWINSACERAREGEGVVPTLLD